MSQLNPRCRTQPLPTNWVPGPLQLGKSLNHMESEMQASVQTYVDPDPVKSFIRADRCGPNPDPEWCYLQKTKACQRFYQ